MSKIVFFCIPAHGHTNPTLGVVKELIARGHEVYYYSYELLRQKIEATGARFIPCDEFDAETKLTPQQATRLGSDLALSTRVLVDSTLALDETVCRHMQSLKPDCIVADSMAVWGKAVALKLGIPFVSSTTTFAFNKHSARIMKKSLKELFALLFAMPRVNGHIRRLRAKGYPIKSILDILQNDDETHTIVYTSPQFLPCAETFSSKYAFVGPSLRPAREEIRKTRERLVYISMGTVNNDMLPFFKQCVAAFQNSEYQVIIAVGDRVSPGELGPLPDHMTVSAHADQIAVLQKADAFITHCGMNSVSEALYYGVPLVMLPQTSEQKGVAARAAQLGAGMILKNGSADSLKNALSAVLADPAYRRGAQLIGEGFKNCPGAKGAADKILSLCEK